MSNLLNQINPAINTAVVAALVAIIGYISKQAVKLIPEAINLLVAKIGLTNYQKLKTVAWDIWNIIEEDGRLGKLTTDKITAFTSLIKQKYPSITDDEINTVRQAIAGEFNKDKPAVIKAIDEPTVTEKVIEPTIIYKTPEGVVLKPDNSSKIVQNDSITSTNVEAPSTEQTAPGA